MSLFTTIVAWIFGPYELSAHDLEVLADAQPRHGEVE